MAKPQEIELTTGDKIPILYEDRSVLAIDKPAGWMLVPFSWQKTSLNLHAALISSIRSGAYWARSRQLRFLRFVHRLDADTTGVLLFAKSPGAVETYGSIFESRRMQKLYLAVVEGVPARDRWTSKGAIAPDARRHGLMCIDNKHGKPAETDFKVLEVSGGRALIEARPYTGRTHQIRIHLQSEKLPIVGDELYGSRDTDEDLGLRALALGYEDPFTRKKIRIRAPFEEFVQRFGFKPASVSPVF